MTERSPPRVRSAVSSGRSIAWWWLLGLVLAALTLFVFYSYVGTLMFGLFLYYAARPVSRGLERRIGSPGVAAALTMLLIVLPFVAVAAAIVLVSIGQLAAIRPADVATFVSVLFPQFDVAAVPTTPEQFYATAGELWANQNVQQGLDIALGAAGAFANAVFHGFLGLVFVFFLLRDDRRLADWFHADIADEGTAASQYLTAVDEHLKGVYFGNLLTIFVVVVLSGIIYSVLDTVAPPGLSIPVPILLAVVTGVATFVPLVGRSVVYLLVGGYLTVVAVRTNPASLWFPALFFSVLLLGLDTLVRYGVRPYLSGRSLHTGLMLFAYLLGTALFGWYGVFYGPFLLVVTVEFARLVLPRLLHGESATERPTPADSDAQQPLERYVEDETVRQSDVDEYDGAPGSTRG